MNYQTPRGTYDILPEEMNAWHDVEDVIKEVTRVYRYQEIRTPYFESTNVFKRENDSSDMVNKEMYTFQMGSDSYTLRPEGTAGVIRAFDQHKLYGSMELPARFYYCGAMFRHERPQKGRQRQFTQFGVENIGAKSPELDAETIALGYDIVKKMGISSVKVLINTLGDDDSRSAYREALKKHIEPHWDELCSDCHRRFEQNPLRILDCKVDKEYISTLNVPVALDALDDENKEKFEKTLKILKDNNVNYEIDKYLVRGLDYYTGIIFEFDIMVQDKILTIGGGGRYSSLVKELDGPDIQCVGFALGINRLALVLSDLYGANSYKNQIDYYIMPMGENTYEIASKIASALRDKNYVTVLEVNKKSFSSMFKYASKHEALFAIMIGEDELMDNKVKIKNLKTQEQFFVSLDDILRGESHG